MNEPTVDEDVKQLITLYGIESVHAAVSRAKVKKVGRPATNDFRKLGEVFIQDARDWLAGRDPIALRTNYSIANTFAAAHPGYNHAATLRRLQRKLKAKRKRIFLLCAMEISHSENTFSNHLNVMDKLILCAPEWPLFKNCREWDQEKVDLFLERHSQPDETFTMDQIEASFHPPTLASFYGVPPRLTSSVEMLRHFDMSIL